MSDNDKLTKGSIGEARAISELLNKNCNVYQNFEANGQIDLIIESKTTKKLLRVDVKTVKSKVRANQRGYPDDGILQLRIDPDGVMWFPSVWQKLWKQAPKTDYYKKTGRFEMCMQALGMTDKKVKPK